MDITKQDFGRFVTERRHTTGLTQRELAGRLHVTESAVSKWERGLSYPDITLVAQLAGELGITAQELISASEDRLGRAERRDARSYRQWRGAVLWTTLGCYAAAILTCFIVNLSVEHTLSWFWPVLPAVVLAFSLTTLPLLPVPRPGWTALVGATVSLGSLLLVVWVSYASGPWFAVACAAILFGMLVVFGPIWLWLWELPAPLANHRAALALGIDTIGLLALLLVIFVSIGRTDLWLWPVLALAGIGLVPVWLIALTTRYLPLSGLGRAAVVVALCGVLVFAVDLAVDWVLESDRDGALDLARWDPVTISANVQFLVLVGLLLLAAVLGLVAGVRRRLDFGRVG
ncbi:helix-turn-helix transcriptional regulator [Leucobacter coleopterorum]|uniref:Helix-turn-helix transcriptional regulator n=1 Tax=Leucobacter coleopterorum TaxID=2714933 RepID=A0ABX6K007_9MICO|nr:helix-turn-helix transcriptional regulator [Leucobacter coleopterorum]QIM18365.1 helix-turn-helix transcriptional regulator [Leucobacter coleopterorum]